MSFTAWSKEYAYYIYKQCCLNSQKNGCGWGEILNFFLGGEKPLQVDFGENTTTPCIDKKLKFKVKFADRFTQTNTLAGRQKIYVPEYLIQGYQKRHKIITGVASYPIFYNYNC